MKFLILTKRRLALITGCICAIVTLTGLSLHTLGVFAGGVKAKKLPIYRVDKQDKVVSISFDAAWGNEQTQTLLDILAQHGVKATFFLVGMWVDKYPESVKAIFDAGHDVGNHSDTHPHMPKLNKEKMTAQIEDCNNKVEKITGKRPELFRPPYGDYDDNLVSTINEIGMHCIQWDVDSLDWKDPSPDEMVKRIKTKVQPGSIILMHNGAKNTPEALPKILEMLKAEGYTLVPISEIIHKQNYKILNDGTQIPA